MIGPFLQGVGVGGGLIVAIGAQNAFVLSQGVRGRYPVLIPTICWLCDLVLILVGMGGLGHLVSANPVMMRLAAWGVRSSCWYTAGGPCGRPWPAAVCSSGTTHRHRCAPPS